VRGDELFALNCAPCHGTEGTGNPALNAPALAGQKVWYLVRQLQKFRDGTRGAHPEDIQGMQMAPIVRLLANDREIKRVAKYISGMPPFQAMATLGGDAGKGKALFTGTCMPCHGGQGEGKQILNAPMLAGQADWYLVRQLTKFKQGIRGSHKEDSEGMQMMAMAKTLVDEESMTNLAAYINRLRDEEIVEVAQDVIRDVLPASAEGEASFALNCAPCHKTTAEGDYAFNAPALAGQKAWYLARQLKNFKAGTRGSHPEDVEGMQMAAMVRLLADEKAIDEVVAHVAAMAPFDTLATLRRDPEKGKALFVSTCLPCHGEHAEGNPLTNAPMLAGQADWYLVRQITKFKHGIRGAHKNDTVGMQMAAMAKTLIDEQAIQDLAAYINSLR